MIRERENRHVCGEIHEQKNGLHYLFFILISVNSLTQCVLNGILGCAGHLHMTLSHYLICSKRIQLIDSQPILNNK